MTYKILYIEDGDPSSIIADLTNYDLLVDHHDPEDFESTIAKVTDSKVDLLLLDFRLSDKTAIYDAPTLAQTIRTKNTTHHRELPIVLISSEDNISGYYKDYTSQDLFDFAISKKILSENLDKYTTRIKSLIDGYNLLLSSITNKRSLENSLNIPEKLSKKFSPKIIDLLSSNKYKQNTFMASTFIINHIVKPSGVLIGEDVLAARLGVNTQSDGWGMLKQKLNEFKYDGIYSDSYERWWAAGLELWWKDIFIDSPHLKRLTATQRVEKLKSILDIQNIEAAHKSQHSKSDYFWTICSNKKTPLDPIDGFEKDKAIEPWEDPEYFSLIGVTELSSHKVLKILDRKRYLEEVGGL